jgi:hypothetical protein
VPRFAFEAVEEARRRALEIQKVRGGARKLALLLAPIGATGAALALRGTPWAIAAAASLVALALAGGAWALSVDRQARRRLE